jgi:hypothetical protein
MCVKTGRSQIRGGRVYKEKQSIAMHGTLDVTEMSKLKFTRVKLKTKAAIRSLRPALLQFHRDWLSRPD